MQKTVLFLALLFSIQLHAQKIEGVWEGTLIIRGDVKTTMRIRMEIVEKDSSYFGILYSRGVDKSTVYGCDYFIAGSLQKNEIVFKRQKVQRAVAMNEYACSMFQLLELGYRKKDSAETLQGKWVWRGDREDIINCTKVSDAISDMAQDEISGYVKDLYEEYESSGILLAVEDRLPKKILELPVDSTDVIVEFSTIDSSTHDSISVYINGNFIAEVHDLARKPLRLRLKELGPGTNDLLVVSASRVQPKLNIQMEIIYQGELNVYTIQPGFVSSSLVLFNRKE